MQKRRGDKDEKKKKKSEEELRNMERSSNPKIQNKHVGGLERESEGLLHFPVSVCYRFIMCFTILS